MTGFSSFLTKTLSKLYSQPIAALDLSLGNGLTLTGLTPSTIYSFTTPAGSPSISNLTVSPAVNNTAKLSWTTSVPTYSYVQYGPSEGNYTRYSAQTSLTASPTCTLPYVPSGTVHYQLVSTDAAGNQTASADMTFIEP